jgi:hypothetical protein
VRVTILIACLFVTAPATAQRRLDTLTPAQAISRAAASTKPIRAVFEFKVQNAVKSRGGFYLDSERNFHSAANLGVSIRPSALPGLTQKYGADLKAALVGKTIKVIGQVHRRSVARGTATSTEVEVTHPGQILSAS